jgi:hypothetical protein
MRTPQGCQAVIPKQQAGSKDWQARVNRTAIHPHRHPPARFWKNVEDEDENEGRGGLGGRVKRARKAKSFSFFAN